VNLNDEELISLLKLGQNNTYQKILNKSLKLNLTKDQYLDKNISFKDWVKKFIKNKNDLKDKEKLLNQYNEYIKQQNNKKNNNNEEDNEKNEEDDINNTKKINDIDIDLTDNKMKNNFYLGKNEEIKNNDNLEKNLQLKTTNLKNLNNPKDEISTNKNKKPFNIDDVDYNKFSELYNYKTNRNSERNNNILSIRYKRDTSKDIYIPNDLKLAYNLIRNKSCKNEEELHREFKDEADKF
jgi:hypothetical protein